MLAAIPFSLSIGAAVIVTSIISGIFGMAGGLVLMLILGLVLPVQSAMVLHGVTQFVSNGWRAFLWRQWIDWKIVGLYVFGALPAIAVPIVLAYVPDRPVMLITLGLVPFLAAALPKRWALDATKPWHAVACGFSVAGLQLIAGVAGPLLDTFFVRSKIDRRAVVATKAVTQAVSHTLKVGYYATLLSQVPALGLDVYGAAIAAAVIGTTLAGSVLEKMTNESFRRWTKTIVLVIGAISITQGVWLLLRT
ncbi:MAG: sulfite exporter TauE/SafE family protein [Alphaproteobacteria bacterium]|nr:sulfite exporter TauE/SafE family protein [Alphaproteobacteria bacterium]